MRMSNSWPRLIRDRRGIIGGVVTLFWITVIIAVILIFFVFSAALIRTISHAPRGVASVDLLGDNPDFERDIAVYMRFFEGRAVGIPRCVVDPNTLVVLNGPCLCPSFGDLSNVARRERNATFDVCAPGDHCYFRTSGCSSDFNQLFYSAEGRKILDEYIDDF